jgi:hypothetical protein
MNDCTHYFLGSLKNMNFIYVPSNFFCNRKNYFQITTNDGEINPRKSFLSLLNLFKNRKRNIDF